MTTRDKSIMFDTGYPVIDSDPSFSRVVRYLRPTDYALWAGTTVGLPSLFSLWERVDPTQANPRQLRSALRMNGFLGFCGGFLLAYQSTSLRFWGWRENAREAEMDKVEMTSRVQKGLPVYGESTIEPYFQGVAARNSTNAALFFSTFPMFNFVNHKYHGVDTAEKYGEQQTGFVAEDQAPRLA